MDSAVDPEVTSTSTSSSPQNIGGFDPIYYRYTFSVPFPCGEHFRLVYYYQCPFCKRRDWTNAEDRNQHSIKCTMNTQARRNRRDQPFGNTPPSGQNEDQQEPFSIQRYNEHRWRTAILKSQSQNGEIPEEMLETEWLREQAERIWDPSVEWLLKGQEDTGRCRIGETEEGTRVHDQDPQDVIREVVTGTEPEVAQIGSGVTGSEPKEMIVSEDEVTASEQEVVTVADPDVSAPDPDVTAPNPDVTAPYPDVTAPNPDVTVPNPDVTAPSPIAAAPDLDVTTPDPEVTAPDPEVTAPDPEVTVSEPEGLVVSEPEETASEPESEVAIGQPGVTVSEPHRELAEFESEQVTGSEVHSVADKDINDEAESMCESDLSQVPPIFGHLSDWIRKSAKNLHEEPVVLVADQEQSTLNEISTSTLPTVHPLNCSSSESSSSQDSSTWSPNLKSRLTDTPHYVVRHFSTEEDKEQEKGPALLPSGVSLSEDYLSATSFNLKLIIGSGQTTPEPTIPEPTTPQSTTPEPVLIHVDQLDLEQPEVIIDVESEMEQEETSSDESEAQAPLDTQPSSLLPEGGHDFTLTLLVPEGPLRTTAAESRDSPKDSEELPRAADPHTKRSEVFTVIADKERSENLQDQEQLEGGFDLTRVPVPDGLLHASDADEESGSSSEGPEESSEVALPHKERSEVFAVIADKASTETLQEQLEEGLDLTRVPASEGPLHAAAAAAGGDRQVSENSVEGPGESHGVTLPHMERSEGFTFTAEAKDPAEILTEVAVRPEINQTEQVTEEPESREQTVLFAKEPEVGIQTELVSECPSFEPVSVIQSRKVSVDNEPEIGQTDPVAVQVVPVVNDSPAELPIEPEPPLVPELPIEPQLELPGQKFPSTGLTQSPIAQIGQEPAVVTQLPEVNVEDDDMVFVELIPGKSRKRAAAAEDLIWKGKIEPEDAPVDAPVPTVDDEVPIPTPTTEPLRPTRRSRRFKRERVDTDGGAATVNDVSSVQPPQKVTRVLRTRNHNASVTYETTYEVVEGEEIQVETEKVHIQARSPVFPCTSTSVGRSRDVSSAQKKAAGIKRAYLAPIPAATCKPGPAASGLSRNSVNRQSPIPGTPNNRSNATTRKRNPSNTGNKCNYCKEPPQQLASPTSSSPMSKIKCSSKLHPITCSACEPHYGHLHLSVRSEFGQKSFKCPICLTIFKSKASGFSHLKLHRKGKPFRLRRSELYDLNFRLPQPDWTTVKPQKKAKPKVSPKRQESTSRTPESSANRPSSSHVLTHSRVKCTATAPVNPVSAVVVHSEPASSGSSDAVDSASSSVSPGSSRSESSGNFQLRKFGCGQCMKKFVTRRELEAHLHTHALLKMTRKKAPRSQDESK